MLKVMGIDFFKRKVISWFFKPDRDGWYVDQRKIDQETIQHRIWHASGEKMAVYKVIKGQITSYKYATGFNTFINVEISDLITKGSKTSFKIKFGSRSFKGECEVIGDKMIETNWIDTTPTIITYKRVQPS